jgi:ABC-2 type transport system ATP-binding protein
MADEIILVHKGKVVLSGALDTVRNSFGKNTLHIDYEGDGSFLDQLPEVKRALIVNNAAELSLNEGADPQRVLEATVGRLRVRKFEIASPSLEEIFIEQVGAETMEAIR